MAEDHVDALAIGPTEHASSECSRQRAIWGAMTRDRDAQITLLTPWCDCRSGEIGPINRKCMAYLGVMTE
jgi:hypothetical protein